MKEPCFYYEHTKFELLRPLRAGRVVSCFRVSHPAGYCFDGEYHDFWEFVCVLNGKLGVAAENRVIHLEAGQIVFHKPMEFHRLWTRGEAPAELMIFSFEGEGMQEFEDKILTLPYRCLRELETLYALSREAFVFQGAGIVGVQEDAAAGQRFLNGLESFLLGTLRFSNASGAFSRSQSARDFSLIVEILTANTDKNLTLGDVAQLCGMSVGSLKKVFRQYAGIGVMKYFTGLKMRRAVELLESGCTVAQTSDALSYCNQNYFSASFKRELGKPPSAYKKR